MTRSPAFMASDRLSRHSASYHAGYFLPCLLIFILYLNVLLYACEISWSNLRAIISGSESDQTLVDYGIYKCFTKWIRYRIKHYFAQVYQVIMSLNIIVIASPAQRVSLGFDKGATFDLHLREKAIARWSDSGTLPSISKLQTTLNKFVMPNT